MGEVQLSVALNAFGDSPGLKQLRDQLEPIVDLLGVFNSGLTLLLDNVRSLNDFYNAQSNYDNAVARRDNTMNKCNAAIKNCLDPETWRKPDAPPKRYRPGITTNTSGLGSADPNEKLTVGYGAKGFVQKASELTFTIHFENMPTADVPAQLVTVVDQLDSKLDWSTFAITEIAFNNTSVPVSIGARDYDGTAYVPTDKYPVRIQVRLKRPLDGGCLANDFGASDGHGTAYRFRSRGSAV